MENEIIKNLKSDKEFLWINPNFDKDSLYDEVSSEQIYEANDLLIRF